MKKSDRDLFVSIAFIGYNALYIIENEFTLCN